MVTDQDRNLVNKVTASEEIFLVEEPDFSTRREGTVTSQEATYLTCVIFTQMCWGRRVWPCHGKQL